MPKTDSKAKRGNRVILDQGAGSRGLGLQREEGSSQGWTSESLVSRRLLGHLANEARRGLWLKGPHGAPPCPSHPVRAKLSAPGTITPFLDRSSIQIHSGS